MASALALPSSHSESTTAPTGRPPATSPIALKPQTTKAPSKTVKMFFPGDDDEEEAPTSVAAGDSGSKANLLPPVKDTTSASPAPGSSKHSEFVASKLTAPATVSPATSTSSSRAHPNSSPLQKANGRTVGHATPSGPASLQSSVTHSTPKTHATPERPRVIRDEAPRPTTSPLAGPGHMPPPAPSQPRTTHPKEHASVMRTPTNSVPARPPTETPPTFVPENKAVRAVAESSNAKRPDRSPAKAPKSVSDYQIICQVGEGTFGKVYKARSAANPDSFVALKRIRMEGEKDGFPVTAMREIKLLQSLRHENVVNLHEMMVSKGKFQSLLALVSN